jgi:hypothetical protein
MPVTDTKHENQDRKVSEDRFRLAVDLRKFEIELFWKRSVFFWGFIAAAFVAYGVLRKNEFGFATMIMTCFGLICSVAWMLANFGSKFWQENWEASAVREGRKVGFEDFFLAEQVQDKGLLRARKYSVSRLVICLSCFTVGLWALILGAEVWRSFQTSQPHLEPWIAVPMATATGLTCFYLLIGCRSNPEMRPAQSEEKSD